MVPSAMLRAPTSSGSSSTLQQRTDSPPANERCRQVLAETGAAGDLAVAAGQGAQFERPGLRLRQDDGAALGVERADGVIENGVQQVLFAFQVHQVVTGAQEGQKLFARTRAAVAVVSQTVDGVFPGIAGGRLHQQVFPRLGDVVVAALFEQVNDQGHIAAAEDIVSANGPFARTKPGAVQEGAIGASQVSDAPAVRGRTDFRVAPTYRRVIEDDLKSCEPAGAEDSVGFPHLALDVAVDAS